MKALFHKIKSRVIGLSGMAFLLMMMFTGCDREDIGPQFLGDGKSTSGENSRKVYILNEGNFQWGNASLSVYSPGKKEIEHHAFANANDFALGDVAQVIVAYNGLFYIVVNNSQKIEVVDTATLKSNAVITGFQSPRYFLGVGQKAYVTDLFAKGVHVLDLAGHSVTGKIPFDDWTEQMVHINGKVYCGTVNKGLLLEIGPVDDQILDTIKLTPGVGRMVPDKNGKLWVLSRGGGSLPGRLVRINTSTNKIERSFDFDMAGPAPLSLDIDAAGENLFFIYGDIYKMAIDDQQLPAKPFITAGPSTFTTLSVDPYNNEVYIADPLDYNQDSDVFRYAPDGELIDQFKGGIITTQFHF